MNFSNFFSLVIIIVFCCLPVVFWGYIFSYIDEKLANRRRFLFWIIAWIVSTFPVLYFWNNSEQRILKNFDFPNIISSFDLWNGTISWLILVCFVIILLMSMSGYVLSLFQRKAFETMILYIKNIFFFMLGAVFISWFLSIIWFFFSIFPNTNIPVSDGVQYWRYLYESLKVIIFYYLIIGFIEESSKHFHFLSWVLPSVKNTKEIVLLSVFVALWFSFTENIIYMWKIYAQIWFGGDIVRTYIFRSCFSLMLHVICSAILSHIFSIVWYRRQIFSAFSLFLFLSGILWSITLHSIFNISLTLSLGFVPFLYFLGWYLYVSSIFYKNTILTSTESEI